MKNTIIYGAVTGLLLTASMDAAAMDFCAQSSKPDVCYGAQFRMVESVRQERNQKVRQTDKVDKAWKTKWLANEANFEQWVNANCRNIVCAKEQVEKHNNWAYWRLQPLGIVK